MYIAFYAFWLLSIIHTYVRIFQMVYFNKITGKMSNLVRVTVQDQRTEEVYEACESALTSCRFIFEKNNPWNQKRASANADPSWSSLGRVPQIKWSRESARRKFATFNINLQTDPSAQHQIIIFVCISCLPLWPFSICRPESTAVSAFHSIYPDYFCWIGRS